MIWLIVLIQICSSSSLSSAIAVQDERRAELARAMLSRSPQSPLHPQCNGKGTTFPLRSTNFQVSFF